MASLNGNSWYVLADVVDISAYVIDVGIEPKNAAQDITAGSGQTHTQVAAGLDTYSLKLSVIYDISVVPTYIQKLKPGASVAIEYGPEGQVAGKPRHVQTFLIESSNMGQAVTKEKVMFEVSGQGTGAPSANMFAGAVY